MTVSLTTDSSSTIPPTPNDMTSTTTTSPSPPVPPSSNIEAASPTSLAKTDEVVDSECEPNESEAVKSMALDSNHGDETEDETATEYAGDDESNHVLCPNKSDSDCKVPVNVSKRGREVDKDDERPPGDDCVNDTFSDVTKKCRLICEDKQVNLTSKSNPNESQVDSTEAVKETFESGPISSEDVAEMARLRAAKFIQERTKMACILNSSESESTKLATSSNPVSASQQGSSRKRKLTVKDILVSQRNRDSGSKQHRHQNEPSNTNNMPFNHVFPGLGQMLDPNLQMNEANPFAAISAALAAASAQSPNGPNSNGVVSNGTNLPSGIVSDNQSAYISSLASTLSSNANPTATLALMASLSAMMQNSSNKETNDGAATSVNAASNPLVSLESTLANVMASNFGHSSQPNLIANNTAHDDEDEDDPIDGHVPLDFSRKNFVGKDEKSTSRRKSRKKVNGEGASEEETPLDLSVSTKRPDELHTNKQRNLLSSMFPQVPAMEGNNGSNFAAMAAAAAAAAAAASFSPNLLTKMAASMAPWSGYGVQGLKLGNDSSSAAAAFNVLFQQMSNNNGNSTVKSNNSISPNNSNNLFQSFPDLYWNGKLSSKTPTPSPSFGVLSNSSTSLSARHHHHQPPPAASQPMRTKSSSGRQNPWQAQWINRSSEQTRDVFTCVWCKESFKSLAEMTDHMKRSPRCGMAGMQQHHSHHHNSHANQPSGHQPPQASLGPATQATGKLSLGSPPNSMGPTMKEPLSHNSNTTSGNTSSSASAPGSAKTSGVNMPRKLVRGQDVWLGRGAEQTRQILKCMWCGQSFKSLADMTQHMKITQHYTNIISQEQITSWRTPEEKLGQSQVNAVLTCKVCDEAFSSLKELSNHMIKNSHFKENSTRDSSGRSTPTSTPVPPSSTSRNGRPTTGAPSSDRRKKSLPVRKLLELERGEFKKSGDEDDAEESQKSPKSTSSQLIGCDDCHEKIEPRCFLQHIKQCRLRNTKSDAESDKIKVEIDEINADETRTNIENEPKDDSKNVEKNTETDKKESNGPTKESATGEETSSAGSVLSALEKLIEKNFDSKSRRSQQTGILQRLGIDEEVFPPWQNMAPSPLSVMSPSLAAWNSMNGMEFSRSNSSSSSNNSRLNSAAHAMPQLRYRRNSSSSLKDKFLSGLNASMKATESNGSFSSQETEEEESCDESNSDCGSTARSQKRPLFSRSPEKSGLNFPISSMLSSPVAARPTSASSTASSISPSSVTPSQATGDQLHRMTPSSHRSAQDEEYEENDFSSPLSLCKKSTDEDEHKKGKVNGTNEDAEESENGERPAHNPLLQLQKLLDKTDTSARHPGNNKLGANANQRMSPFAGWPESNLKVVSPASSPRTPHIYSPSSASVKSESEATSVKLKCAFCDAQVTSRDAYRSHLAKVHLLMRDSVDLSAVSDEELLLLVLAKNSNLPLVPGHNSGLLAVAGGSTKVSPRPKESARKPRKSSKNDLSAWDKSPNNSANSPTASPQLETPQSKFLKYAELAKQLSSKYV